MSIKIFDGFVIAESMASLTQLHALATDLRNQVRPLAENHLKKMLIADAVDFYDMAQLGLFKKTDVLSCLSRAYNKQDDERRQLKQKRWRTPRYDVGFSIGLLPHPDGRVLGITYTERREWLPLFLEKPGISEYAYWDSTDEMADGVDAAGWRKREADWHLVLIDTKDKIPALNGFDLMIHEEGQAPYLGENEDVSSHMPSVEQRARHLAMSTTIHRLGITDYRKIGSAVIEFVEDGEHHPLYLEEVERISGLLNPDLTLETLRAA